MTKTLRVKNLKEIEAKNSLADVVILSLPIHKKDILGKMLIKL